MIVRKYKIEINAKLNNKQILKMSILSLKERFIRERQFFGSSSRF